MFFVLGSGCVLGAFVDKVQRSTDWAIKGFECRCLCAVVLEERSFSLDLSQAESSVSSTFV